MVSRTRKALVWTEDDLASYRRRQAKSAKLTSVSKPKSPKSSGASAPKLLVSHSSGLLAREVSAKSKPKSKLPPSPRSGTTELQETLRSFLGINPPAHPRRGKSTLSPTSSKVKRRGLNTKPIKDSLAQPEIKVFSSNKIFAVWFTGARAFTVNELIALYQYRKYETFGYKKLWQGLIQKAVTQAQLQGDVLPYFTHHTRLTLYRRGTRLVDLDSLPAMFKYTIDSLKKAHLIAEDNPNVITKLIPFQEQGEPVIALRLEQLPLAKKALPDFAKVWLSPHQLKLD